MNEQQVLKQKVKDFVEQQTGYNAAYQCEPSVSYEGLWVVNYGFETQFTISGHGDASDKAYENFVLNWGASNGFKGIRDAMHELKKLKEEVLTFVEQQEGYPGLHENIRAWAGGPEWIVVYGENIEVGIAGVGTGPSEAYEDFLRNWSLLNGFARFRKDSVEV